MTTFKVDDVQKAHKPLPENKLKVLDQIEAKIAMRPVSYSSFLDYMHLIHAHPLNNSLVEAVDKAYKHHYPLILSPDIIWQCVAQGFAIHVNKNAEKLRHMFVDHERKIKLKVRRDDFVKGSPDNDWEQVFEGFSDEIRKNVGDEIHDLLTPDFSTTGSVEKIASQIVLMNTLKEYFDYQFGVVCGIPSVTLEGTVEDWKKLREKTLSLSRFDFQWWTDAVKLILDEFVNTSSGVVNTRFWQSLYKISKGCGGPFISGWIVILFPYVESEFENMRQNFWLEKWDKIPGYAIGGHGIVIREFPSGTVSTPFTWQHLGEEFDMCFHAGFMGVGKDKKNLALKPLIGWAVSGSVEEQREDEEDYEVEQNSKFCRCC